VIAVHLNHPENPPQELCRDENDRFSVIGSTEIENSISAHARIKFLWVVVPIPHRFRRKSAFEFSDEKDIKEGYGTDYDT
jgi:hypothetical protein